MSALRVGIMLPSRETAMTGRHDARGLVEFAKVAEDAGFDSVWVGDSLLARTRAEPLSILSAVAAVTDRVALGTAALIAPLRHPLLAAAQAATVDQLSGGRLILGLGSGAPLPESRREFDAVGMPFAGRGARLDETVALWRQTWDGQGEFADALPAARSGGPPVWLAGGDTAKVIERVSATYDGWLPYLPDVNAYARAWDRIRAQAVRDITPALYATVNLNDDRTRADEELDEYLRAYYGQPLDVMRYVQAIRGGSMEECLDWLARYVDAGARHLIVRIGSLTARPESVAEQLLPALKGAWNAMTEVPDAETMKAFNKNIVDEFRANGGVVGGPFEGATLLLLTSTGAKSGQPRLAPLAYLTVDGKMIIIGSKAGSDTNPDWVHNLRANPKAHIEVGAEAYDVTARELPPEERDGVYPKVVAVAPGFGEYQAKTSRVIPLFQLQRA